VKNVIESVSKPTFIAQSEASQSARLMEKFLRSLRF